MTALARSLLFVAALVTGPAMADGEPDPSFGLDGRFIVSVGSGPQSVLAMQVDSGGRLLAVVRVQSSTASYLVRLTPNGRTDPGFGTNGAKLLPALGGPGCTVAAFGNGIVCAGVNNDNIVVMKMTMDGDLDTSFAPGFISGRRVVDFGGVDEVGAIKFSPDQRIIVVGTRMQSSTSDVAVARLTSTGDLDTTFSGDGLLVFGFHEGGGLRDTGTAVSIVAGTSTRILVGATSDHGTGGDRDFAVARLNDDGSFDTNFSGDGKLTVRVDAGGNLRDELSEIVVFVSPLADRYYLIGSAAGPSTPPLISTLGAIVALMPNGLRDPAFNGSGCSFQTGCTAFSYPMAVFSNRQTRAIVGATGRAGTGSVLVAGYGGDATMQFARRFLPTGEIDPRHVDGQYRFSGHPSIGHGIEAIAYEPGGRRIIAAPYAAASGSTNAVVFARFEDRGSLLFRDSFE